MEHGRAGYTTVADFTRRLENTPDAEKRDVWADFFCTYRGWLIGYASHCTHARLLDPADIAQETLLSWFRAYQDPARRPKPEAVIRGWLRKTCGRICWKSFSRFPHPDSDSIDAPTTADIADQREGLAYDERDYDLADCMEQLSGIRNDCLLLWLQEKPLREIAQTLGLGNQNTVGRRLKEATDELRRCLKAKGREVAVSKNTSSGALCEQVQARLFELLEYAEGPTPGDSVMLELREHLTGCPSCQSEREWLVQFRGAGQRVLASQAIETEMSLEADPRMEEHQRQFMAVVDAFYSTEPGDAPAPIEPWQELIARGLVERRRQLRAALTRVLEKFPLEGWETAGQLWRTGLTLAVEPARDGAASGSHGDGEGVPMRAPIRTARELVVLTLDLEHELARGVVPAFLQSGEGLDEIRAALRDELAGGLPEAEPEE